jgi:ketosteroid isomerase-like protein
MSWRNIETLRRCLSRFQARDEARFLELMHSEVDLVPAIVVIEPGEASHNHYHGHDGVREWFADIDQLSSYRVEFDQFTRAGEDVLVTGRVFFEPDDGDGQVYDVYYLFRFRDGLVESLRTYREHDEALAAAGLPD